MPYALLVSVYVELVLFNNVAIDFLLIVLVQAIRRRKFFKLRSIITSLLGGVVATLYAISPKPLKIAIKILLAPLMTLLFDNYQGVSLKARALDYIKSLIAFVLVTYGMGGITYGLSFALGVDVNSYAIEGLIALSIAIALLCIRALWKKKNQSALKTCETLVSIGGRKIKAVGLCDSGNTLVDNVSGLPVVVLSQKFEDEVGKLPIEGFADVATVGGECSMPLVRLDEIQVDGKRTRVYGALARRNFENYDIILQNSTF